MSVHLELLPVYLLLAFSGLTALYGIHYLAMYFYARLRPHPERPLPLEEFPIVTIQITVYNEGKTVEPNLRAISELNYPKEKLQIQICDDSTDPETIEICRRWKGFLEEKGYWVEHLRRPERKGYKGGNLNHALPLAKGEFIAIVDADFILPPDFLEKNIPIFLNDPEVGFIQSHWKHINRNANLLTEGIGASYDMHLYVEQRTRSNWGFWLEFNGSGGIWRKRALEDIGGWPEGIGIEDVYASLLVQGKGWKGKFLEHTASYGRLPETFESFLDQQNRWAMGCGEILNRHFWDILKMKRPLRFKMMALFHLGGYIAHVGMSGILLTFPLAAFVLSNNPKWQWTEWPIALGFALLTFASSLLFRETDRRVGNTALEGLKNSFLAAMEETGKTASVSVRFFLGLFGKKLQSWVPTNAKKGRNKMLADKIWMSLLIIWNCVGIFIALKSGLYILIYPSISICSGLIFLLSVNYFSRMGGLSLTERFSKIAAKESR